jgi:hypothetical protein
LSALVCVANIREQEVEDVGVKFVITKLEVVRDEAEFTWRTQEDSRKTKWP